jgi:hypothetical protein
LAQNQNFEHVRKNIKSQDGIRNRGQLQISGENSVAQDDKISDKRYEGMFNPRAMMRKKTSSNPRAFTCNK